MTIWREEFGIDDARMSQNTALDLRLVQRERWASNRGYRFKTFNELSIEPVAKRWLVKNIFARGETSAWIAPPGAMKSALMADAAVAVAGGLDWHGYRNKGAAGVVYFAIERADLVEKRLLAHGQRQQFASLPIVVAGGIFELTKPGTFKGVVDTIRNAEECLDMSIGLAIFDTHSKLIAAGGGDENSAKDQNAIFANMQHIKNATDVHLALVGHTGKDETRGARGSNALLGDVDLMVTIDSAGEIRTARVTKANDAPEGPLFSFKSEIHEFELDEDGDPNTVNIVSAEEVSFQSETKSSRGPKLSEPQEVMLRILRDAGAVGLSVDEWNAKAREAGIGITRTGADRRSKLVNVRGQLKDRDLIREYNGIWHVQK